MERINKKYLLHIFMLFTAISIQISLPGCDDSDTVEVLHTVEVFEPTNDYNVIVQIFGLGPMSCAAAGVVLDNSYIENAEITINGNQLTFSDSSDFGLSSSVPIEMELKYMYGGNQISFTAGTKYILEASHNGTSIASGTAYMPKTPEITNIESPYDHSIDTPLLIEWDEDENTTLFGVSCQTDIQDEYGNSTEKSFDTTLSSSATSVTIPDTFFNAPGEYMLIIQAGYGIDPSVVSDDPDSTKGYNIEGPIGSFLVMTAYPSDPMGDGFIINIPDPNGRSNTRAILNKSYKQFLIEKINRLK